MTSVPPGFCILVSLTKSFQFLLTPSQDTSSLTVSQAHETNADLHTQSKLTKLNILYTNCRNLFPIVSSQQLPNMCETWLDDTIVDSELFIPSFSLVRSRHGGGIAIFIHDSTRALKHPVWIPSQVIHSRSSLCDVGAAPEDYAQEALAGRTSRRRL